jgi:formylmethanofuran dehydrogenase subunit C
MITLTALKQFKYPVQAECITPDTFQGKTSAEIAALPVYEGNQALKLGDLFKIEESPAEAPSITINGDVSEVRRIGQGMKIGEIVINGNAGMHMGEKMRGGKITVNGNAAQWAGSVMKKGIIEIHGDAGDYLASPYRGVSEGMKGGKIIVDGNVGSDSGCYVRGGIIKIKGNAGPFLGFHMSDGIIHVEKNTGPRLGANMVGGKIVVGGQVDYMLPSFTVEGTKAKQKIDDTETVPGPFYVFLGDLAEKGTGKLFILKAKNPLLGPVYDKYL